MQRLKSLLIVSAEDRARAPRWLHATTERVASYGVVGEVTLGCMVGCGEAYAKRGRCGVCGERGR